MLLIGVGMVLKTAEKRGPDGNRLKYKLTQEESHRRDHIMPFLYRGYEMVGGNGLEPMTSAMR
jgi:hypothetical protein